MDAFLGYNQISLYELDQVYTSFITDNGLYCYTVMSFGLKNIGTTYLKFINSKVLEGYISKQIEFYIDAMIFKTASATS